MTRMLTSLRLALLAPQELGPDFCTARALNIDHDGTEVIRGKRMQCGKLCSASFARKRAGTPVPFEYDGTVLQKDGGNHPSRPVSALDCVSERQRPLQMIWPGSVTWQ